MVFFLCSRIFQPQHCWHFGSENHMLLGVILCKVGCLAASQATFSGHQQHSPTVTTKNVSRRCHYWLKTTMKNWKGKLTHITELNANVNKIPYLNLTHLQLLLLPIYCQVFTNMFTRIPQVRSRTVWHFWHLRMLSVFKQPKNRMQIFFPLKQTSLFWPI